MKLFTLIIACSLSSSVLAIADTTFDERKLFVRTRAGRRRQRPGKTGTNQKAASSSPQRSHTPSPDGWSDTSDSDRSSLDSPRQGGSGDIVVNTKHPCRISCKEKGSKPTVRETGDGWDGARFKVTQKSRVKVNGLTDESWATLRMENGKSKLVVDTRGDGDKIGHIGIRDKWYQNLDVAKENDKTVLKGDTSKDFTRMGSIQGKGTIRANLVPKLPKDLDIPKPDPALEMPE